MRYWSCEIILRVRLDVQQEAKIEVMVEGEIRENWTKDEIGVKWGTIRKRVRFK